MSKNKSYENYEQLNIFEIQTLISSYLGVADETLDDLVANAELNNQTMYEASVEEFVTATDAVDTLFEVLRVKLGEAPDDEDADGDEDEDEGE